MMNFLRVFGIAALSVIVLGSAQAQEPRPEKLYEQGVNAYFDGRSCQADALLSEAIQSNSQDPLAYYFRALSLLREGRTAEAQGDMLVGAKLEAESPHRLAVGAALERIQGADRLMLEQFRNRARREAAMSQTSANTELPQAPTAAQSVRAGHLPAPAVAPPQTFKESDSGVLRERRIVPLEELLRPGGPQTIVEEPQPATPPQTNTPPSEPAEKAAPPGTPAANPFEDDTRKPPAKPAAAPPKVPPQTAPPSAPPASAPASPPSKSDENPFG